MKKSLEAMETSEVMIQLVRVEHCLLHSYVYHHNLIPYLSKKRQVFKAEYERRLYGRNNG